MYKHALEVLCKTILPYVVGVHGLEIPYPAALIREGVPISESGSVVFRLDERGSFMAEYFAYDVHPWDVLYRFQTQSDEAIYVRLDATGIELPVGSINSSRKTSTVYTDVNMPQVGACECIISGWIGDPSAEMKSAVASLDGCSVLPLLSRGERSLRGAEEGVNGLPFPSYYDSRTSEVIQLTAGGWEVSLNSFSEDKRDSLNDEPPYSVSIKRSEGSTFQLSEQTDVLRLLRLLLSLSSERWVNYSTIFGQTPKARPVVANRAFVGRFASRGWSKKRKMSIKELGEWPILFKGLWHYGESPQMLSALTHLISCGDRSKDGFFSYQDLVEAYGALEAAVRLWSNLDPAYSFYGKDESHSFTSHLRTVVLEFRIGTQMLDSDEVLEVVPRASKYRGTLAHGSGGEFFSSGNEQTGKLFAHSKYLYYLARLLVLAKLGGSSGHPGFPYHAPKLVDA